MKSPRNPIKKALSFAEKKSSLFSVGKKIGKSQLDLELNRPRQDDRNFSKGGRSFYFFDFDDNILYLSTKIYLFHKESKQEISLTSGEFARSSHQLGKRGEYKDYKIILDDENGSFRDFRDKDLEFFEKVFLKKQSFVKDIMDALYQDDFVWKGPSWDCFYHAVYNKRPVSIITARGHEATTIRQGINYLVQKKHLSMTPNFMNIYPVNNKKIRKFLGDESFSESVSVMKKKAIIASVDKAFQTYGYNSHHRFGMSDDDVSNVELILEAMLLLKRTHPDNSFFIFDSSSGELVKREVFLEHVEEKKINTVQQMSLF